MKVTFIKAQKMGSHTFKKGDNALLVPSIAQQLIDKGVCEVNNSVTLRDKIIEGQGQEIGEAILEELPEKASEIVKMIPSISNNYALNHLASVENKKISDAAKDRLKELK